MYTVESFLREEELWGLALRAGGRSLQAEITSTSTPLITPIPMIGSPLEIFCLLPATSAEMTSHCSAS